MALKTLMLSPLDTVMISLLYSGSFTQNKPMVKHVLHRKQELSPGETSHQFVCLRDGANVIQDRTA